MIIIFVAAHILNDHKLSSPTLGVDLTIIATDTGSPLYQAHPVRFAVLLPVSSTTWFPRFFAQ